ATTHGRDIIYGLRDKGLLVAEGSSHATRDEKLRATHWRCASAVMHFASRWSGIDAHQVQQQIADTDGGDLLSRLGTPEPVVRERAVAVSRRVLPPAPPSALEDLLSHRVTCRNFDAARALTLQQFSTVLYRAWGARTVHDFAPNVPLLKKGVPSAG